MRTCLITGGTFGIGRATALGLARQGARVVIVGHDAERTGQAVEWLQATTGNPKVEHVLADLSSQSDIRRLARDVCRTHDRLDVLINNAGGIFARREATVDGVERTWALNHLACVLLTLELLDLLKASAPARVINVASDVHASGTIDFDDLQGVRRYGAMRAYRQSKLANILFTYALARRLAGTGVTANCVHPGAVATGLGRNMRGFFRLLMTLIRPFQLTPEQGAATSIHLASSPQVAAVSGRYFVKARAAPSSAASHDEAMQERLWEISLRQVGARGDVPD